MMNDLNPSWQDTASSTASSGVASLLRTHETPNERPETFVQNPRSLSADTHSKGLIRTIPYFTSKHAKSESMQKSNKGHSLNKNKDMEAAPMTSNLARNLKKSVNLHNNRIIEVVVPDNKDNEETFSSNLHTAVSSPISTISSMKDALSQLGAVAASTSDSDGRLPLHLLSKNTVLITMLLNQEKYSPLYPGGDLQNHAPTVIELERFIVELLRLYPSAIVSEDFYGKIPFLYAIDDWIDNIRKRTSCVSTDIASTESIAPSNKQRPDNVKERSGRSLLELMKGPVNNANAEGEGNMNHSSRSLRASLTTTALTKSFRSAYSENDAKSAGTRAVYRLKKNKLGDIEQSADAYNKRSGKGPELMEQKFDNEMTSSNRNISNSFREIKSEIESERIDWKNNPHTQQPGIPFDDYWSLDEDSPLDITVPPQVEWCIFMLNTIYECIDHTDMTFTVNQGEDFLERSQVKEKVVTALASTPSFAKFLVLLDPNDPATQRILEFSIIKETLVSKYSIGDWIVHLLESTNSALATRAVNYLELLSELFDRSTLPQKGENDALDRLLQLDYFLLAVLSIENVDELDRASGLRAVKYVLDREIIENRLPVLVLLDVVFLILLPFAFNSLANDFFARIMLGRKHQAMYYGCLSSVLYWILRGFSQMSTTKKVSQNAFLCNNFGLVNLINWSTILMALGGILWMESDLHQDHQNISDSVTKYLAVTVIFLHIKIVCWLYTTNWQVAKCMRILKEAIRDLFWMVALFVIILVSFSQAFHFLAKPNCDKVDGFCEVSNAYIYTYSVVLGQFDIEVFKPFATAIFFLLFTFLTTVVVFNAITATVLHSYQKVQKALRENQTCGHRARLVYIADAKSLFGLFQKMHTTTKFGAVLLFLISSGTLLMFADVNVRQSFKRHGTGMLVLLILVMMAFLLISICILYSHMTSNTFRVNDIENEIKKNNTNESNLVKTFLKDTTISLLNNLIDIKSRKSSDADREKSLKTKAQPSSKSISSNCVVRAAAIPLQAYLKESSEQLKLDIAVDIRASEMKLRKTISELKNALTKKNPEVDINIPILYD